MCRSTRAFLCILAANLLLISCAFYHIPNPEEVNFSGLPKTDNKRAINIINNQRNSDKISFGRYGAEKLVGDLHTWTYSAVELTKRTLKKEGVIISDRSSKILKLSVTDAKVDAAGLEFIASLARCKISLNVETGDGYFQRFEETKNSLNPPWACDNAMASVISSLLEDKIIRDYLK